MMLLNITSNIMYCAAPMSPGLCTNQELVGRLEHKQNAEFLLTQEFTLVRSSLLFAFILLSALLTKKLFIFLAVKMR